MEHGQLSMVADKFPWVFAEALLNACGKEAKLCRRQRVMTPFRLGLALTATCARQRVETIADCHGGFTALFGTPVPSKAFYNQVAKPQGADCARTMTERLVSAMTRKVRGVAQGHLFGAFRHSGIQAGSPFALPEGLREVCPGRFKVVKPAAVELHTTMDRLCDAPTTVVFTPDTTSAQAFLPEPAALRASLLFADRGYGDWPSLRRGQDAGGFFVLRAKAGMNPSILEALREDGPRLRSLRNKPLQVIHAKLPKRQRVARVGQWQGDARPLCLRLIISGNRRTKECCSLLTTLPAPRYPLDMICRAYQWRWQVALRFKEWKSYANLHGFDTTNAAIVEGLLGIAMAAAGLKRCLAHMPPRLVDVPRSTRKVAMCAVPVLGDMVRALKTGDVAGLYEALEAAITYLACHAQRAHLKRDRQTGRSQLGLEPCGAHDGVSELAEAA